MSIEVLLFEVDEMRFGVPSTNVKEVVRAVKLSPLPHASTTIEGLLNLRGAIVPVVNVRTLFALQAKSLHHRDHLIITEVNDRCLALRADSATGLLPLDTQDAEIASQSTRFIAFADKVGDDIVHVLDMESVFALPDARVTELPT